MITSVNISFAYNRGNKLQKTGACPYFSLTVSLLMLISVTRLVQAEVDYWSIIKGYYIEKTKQADAKLVNYLETLTAEELITAGKQASKEAESICPEQVLCEESYGTLEFFYYQYPKAGGLDNLDILFREIKDKTQTNFWRTSLIAFLDNTQWKKRLTVEQIYAIIKNLENILSDKTEHPRLRYEASETIENILEQLELLNFLADPIIQKRLQEGNYLTDLEKEVTEGNLILSDNYRQTQAKILREYNGYVEILLPILNEPNLSPMLQGGILGNLRNLVNKSGVSPKVRTALENAVRNYRSYDKEYWYALAKIGRENLRLHDSVQIVDKMLSDMQNQLNGETGEKARNQLKNGIDSLKRIQKISEKEKQSQSDPNSLKNGDSRTSANNAD